MITLNSEKGLVQIEDWSDIESRPGFVKNLDPSVHTLKSIIGRYIFADKIRCGLSNCHTPHAKGYIVVTEDGHETNIGKDCGKTYFGIEFERMSGQFERDLADFQNREILATFAFHLDELTARVESLRNGERGADWAHRMMRPLLTIGAGCPDTVVRKLTAMIRSRNPEVTIERRATEQESQEIEVSAGRRVPRPHYISESIGRIPGMEALYPENDLRELLIIDLQKHIAEFRTLSIGDLTHAVLRHWAKWTATVESTLDRASNAVANARRLLRATGLDPLLKSLPDDDQRQFSTFIRRLEGETSSAH